MYFSKKTLSIFFLVGWFFNVYGQSQILFKNAVRIGNSDWNTGRFLKLLPDETNKIFVSGMTVGNTDFGLSEVPKLVNANPYSDVFWAAFNHQLDSSNYAGHLGGNNEDFINAVDVNKTTSEALYGGHFKGTINILNKENVCGSGFGTCGFIGKSNPQGEFTGFQKFESTGSLTVRNLKWTKNDNFVVGINYSGSFTIGLNTITAQGLTDTYLAVCDTLFTPIWGVTLSAPGYEFIDAISYNDHSNEITATMSIDPLFKGPVTYTSSSGFTATLTPTSYAYNNVIMIINADNGNLLDHTVIGSPNNYNIENAYTIANNTYVAGSANSELHPDMNDLSIIVPNKLGVDIVGLLYQGLHNFEKSLNPSGSGDDVLSRFNVDELFTFETGPPQFVGLCVGEKSVNTVKSASLSNGKTGVDEFKLIGAVYFIDKDLNLVDSILLDGTGYSGIYDADIDSLGNLYITGDFTGTVDLDPSENSFNLTSAGGWDMFIAQYDVSALLTTSVKPYEEKSLVKIYPVPASDKFYVEANFKKSTSGEIQIQDISGRTLMQEPFANEIQLRKLIPVNFPSEIILVKISTSNENIVRKLIVQR